MAVPSGRLKEALDMMELPKRRPIDIPQRNGLCGETWRLASGETIAPAWKASPLAWGGALASIGVK
jgi:hypothetical protein